MPTMGEATLAVNNVKKIWGEETQVVTPQVAASAAAT
jgi:hypothetical protein